MDIRSGIEELIASLMPDGYPTIENTADLVGMSPRTLQRWLGEAGVTYSELVAACRFNVASTWLRQSDMPVTDIAMALGYTDGSNFARAFRREAHLSPAAYRARHAPH